MAEVVEGLDAHEAEALSRLAGSHQVPHIHLPHGGTVAMAGHHTPGDGAM
jgi:hypothetical protein